MKIKTFLASFFLALFVMAGVNLIAGVYFDEARKNLKKSQSELHDLSMLSEDLVISSQWQTRFARSYVDTKDPQKKDWYNIVKKIIDGDIERPDNYNFEYWDLVIAGLQKTPDSRNGKSLSLEERFLSQNVTVGEISKLKDAHTIYVKMSTIEQIAMNAVDGKFDDGTGSFAKKGKPDLAMAHKLLFNEEYSKLNGDMSLKVSQLINEIEERYKANIKNNEDTVNKLTSINSKLNIALFGMIISSLIFLRLRWSDRARQLMSVVGEMSKGNLSIRAPVYGEDEVSTLSKTINTMADNLCMTQKILEEKVKISEGMLIELEAERHRSEKLLHNILPAAIAERLRDGEASIAEIHPEVTVFFSDIVGFTELSAKLGPTETVQLLNEIFGKFDELVEKYKIEKIKTIGDSYMVVGGVPARDPLHCQHVADFAIEAEKFLEEFSKSLKYPLHMRIGIHTGTVAAGIVGKKRFSYDLWGDVVNVASRYESTSQPDKIHVSEAVKIRLEDDYLFVDGGFVELKGKGPSRSYFLMGKKSDQPQVISFRGNSAT